MARRGRGGSGELSQSHPQPGAVLATRFGVSELSPKVVSTVLAPLREALATGGRSERRTAQERRRSLIRRVRAAGGRDRRLARGIHRARRSRVRHLRRSRGRTDVRRRSIRHQLPLRALIPDSFRDQRLLQRRHLHRNGCHHRGAAELTRALRPAWATGQASMMPTKREPIASYSSRRRPSATGGRSSGEWSEQRM